MSLLKQLEIEKKITEAKIYRDHKRIVFDIAKERLDKAEARVCRLIEQWKECKDENSHDR